MKRTGEWCSACQKFLNWSNIPGCIRPFVVQDFELSQFYRENPDGAGSLRGQGDIRPYLAVAAFDIEA
jgi:hypothetical protein